MDTRLNITFYQSKIMIIIILKGLLVKAKASNMGFDDVQKTITKHIIYLLNQFEIDEKIKGAIQ